MRWAWQRVQISPGKLAQNLFSVLWGRVGGSKLADAQLCSEEKCCGIVCMRERLGEELWPSLNLAICGLGGALMSLLGRIQGMEGNMTLVYGVEI